MPVRGRGVMLFAFILATVALQAAGGHPAGTAALRGFEGDRIEQPFRIETEALSVALRPIGSRTQSMAFERSNGIETVVAASRARAESIAYELADMQGILAAVPFEGGIRFVTGTPKNDRMISAPLLIDARGRPSAAAHWALTAADPEGHRVMHLVIDDAMVRFPLTVSYRVGSSQRPPLSNALRPTNPVVNATGSISGTLTDAVTNAPLADVFVSIFDSTGEFATYGLSNASGTYTTVDGLGTGTYYAVVYAPDYGSELYDNLPCNGCDPTTGTGISVTDGARTTGINFALSPTYAHITGQITSGTSPLSDVVVLFYDNTGNAQASAVSDAGGLYDAAVIAALGPYKARTFNTAHPGLIDVLYNGIACIACNVSSGTSITVSAGLTTSGINFNLTSGGEISGSVTETGGSAVYQAFIEVFNSGGTRVATAQSDFSGNYVVQTGLTAGNYYVLASAYQHSSRLYNNLPCNGCSVTGGTAVAVVAGQRTANITFVLPPTNVTASGRVYDAASSTGLANVFVLFYNAGGTQVALGVTDLNGNYSVTLEPGTYYARTENGANSGYLEQLYSNIDCSGCNPTSGTAINATSGTPITGVDFGLRTNGGRIAGRIISAETGNAIPFASVAVYNSTGQFVTYSIADASGNYLTFDGLTAGTYFATAWASGFGTQLYSGISCVNGCNPTTGTAIAVTAGQTTSAVNFSLGLPIARIAGRVSATNNTPIANASVVIFDGGGSAAASAVTDANGNYVASLASDGTYYALASAAGYGDQLYNGHACNGCDPATGEPIVAIVGTITSNIDFLLQQTNCANMVLDPVSLPNGRVATPYSAQLSTSGSTAPVTYAVVGGDLPDGVALNTSTGLISGTPASAGTFTFTIAATGGDGCSAARAYAVTIDPTDTVTNTVLTAVANPATYGDTVTLTATVTPDGATGTVTFKDNGAGIGTATLDANGVAVLLATFNAGSHPLTAVYGGAPTYQGSTSATVTLVVDKFAPNINWPTPADIVYGTPLSTTQLNATATGVNGASLSGTFIYNPAAGTVLSAGAHQLTVSFQPADQANYSNATSTVTINVRKADPVITWIPGPYTYGDPLGAAQLNASATGVDGQPLAGTFVYNPPAGTILNAGLQTLTTHFTPNDTANYNEADATVSLNAAKADPVFSNLSAPSILIGTASTTIGGKISRGSLYPTGSVSITLNGVTQSAPIAADGTFSSVFATATLVPPGYPIAFDYAGDSNFNAASATSTLAVHYGTTGTKVSNGGGNSGSTIPFRVTVLDANNTNLASSSLQVVAYGVRLVSSATWQPAVSNGNQGPVFDLQANGSYMFTLKTTGLAAGSYVFGYTIGADTTIYTISFTVK